jgi:regulator of protease activity HflC (stomatin/prohibitin superfamily)
MRFRHNFYNYMPITHLFGQPIRRGKRIVIGEWERGLLFRDGQLVETLTPGARRNWSRGVSLWRVDTRPRVLPVPMQEIPTADGIPVKVTLAAIVRVIDPQASVASIQGGDEALYLALQVALRAAISVRTVDELVEARSELNASVLEHVRGTDALGIAVERVEIKDIVLPNDVKKAQAQVLIARAEGRAALERARGETAALRNLANAARLTAENPALYQLRLLQQLAAAPGHTVVIGSAPPVTPIPAPEAR